MKFNPFGKNRQTKKQKREAALFKVEEEGFEHLIKKAGAVTDPAEKLKALWYLRGDIDAVIKEQKDAIAEKGRAKGIAVMQGVALTHGIAVGGAAIAAGSVLGLGVAGGCLLAAAAGGSIVLPIVGKFPLKIIKSVRETYTQKSLNGNAGKYIKDMQGKANVLSGMMETVVAEHAAEIKDHVACKRIIKKDIKLSATFKAATENRASQKKTAPQKNSRVPKGAPKPGRK